MSPSEQALQLFITDVNQIPGVLDVQEKKSFDGRKYICVTVPDTVGGVSWEVTKLQSAIEDKFPSTALNVLVDRPRDKSIRRDEVSQSQV